MGEDRFARPTGLEAVWAERHSHDNKPRMAQPRIRSADQRQIVARGEIRKKPRLSRPHRGGMEYERVEALSDWIKMAAAAGVSQEKIARAGHQPEHRQAYLRRDVAKVLWPRTRDRP